MKILRIEFDIPGISKHAIDFTDFISRPRVITLLKGKNGCGKTTLLEIIYVILYYACKNIDFPVNKVSHNTFLRFTKEGLKFKMFLDNHMCLKLTWTDKGYVVSPQLRYSLNDLFVLNPKQLYKELYEGLVEQNVEKTLVLFDKVFYKSKARELGYSSSEQRVWNIFNGVIAQKEGSIILIDDIQQYLDPNKFRTFIHVLREYCTEKKHQLICTGFSTEMLFQDEKIDLVNSNYSLKGE